MSKYCFGVDVGGTTIKMGLFDTEGNVLDKWEIVTRTENNGENVLPDIAKAIEDKMDEKNMKYPESESAYRDRLIPKGRCISVRTLDGA